MFPPLNRLNRRDVLRTAAWGSAALALGKTRVGTAADESKTAAGRSAAAAGRNPKIRMGFIGVGARGTELLRLVLARPEVEVPAICDINERHLKRALDLVQQARGKRPEGFSKGPDDYRRLLTRDDLGSVLIGTPQELHAVMAIDSMQAGKFVGIEVPACTTVQECWELVRTQEKTGTGYMMLENYLYSPYVMQVLNMAEKGVFGDLTYGAGAYIHEIRGMRFNPDGSLTWRGDNVAKNIGVIYPTHAVGPVCRWMGVNRTDRLVSLVAMSSKSAATHAYAVQKFGANHPAARAGFLNGDTNQALIKTAQGRLIEVRYDTASPRPPAAGQYSLQGTKGAYESAFGLRQVYLEGRSPKEAWEPLENYRDEFQHPYWAQRGEEAKSTGHNGGDYFVVSDFLEAIRSGQSPVDVYDAVTWSVIRPLSAASIAGGGKAVAIPNFKSAQTTRAGAR